MAKTTKKTVETGLNPSSANPLSWVIKGPRLTEKAAVVGMHRTYTFVIHPDANKHQVHDAIKAMYKVTPTKITTTTQATRSGVKRGRPATIRGIKKAYVTLPEGQSIELV